MTALYRPDAAVAKAVLPPQAIVVMVIPQADGRAGLQVQWPPSIPPESIPTLLQSAANAVEQQQALKNGGIVKATALPPVDVLT